jgi:hypothetical protein
MMNELSSQRSPVSMHLRMTGTRHAVNFINYGNYDMKTGLREVIRTEAMEEIRTSRSLEE